MAKVCRKTSVTTSQTACADPKTVLILILLNPIANAGNNNFIRDDKKLQVSPVNKPSHSGNA
jgi:hypothetical protein